MRIKRVVLENHCDISILGNDVVYQFSVDIQFARRDFFKPRDHTERGRLTAAGRSYEYDEFFIPNVKAEIEHRLISAGIHFVDAF